MVIMPEWQGAGVGLRFLNWIMENEITGGGRFGDRVRAGYFHTSHPGLCAALRRDPRWEQVSAVMHGGKRSKSHATIKRSTAKKIAAGKKPQGMTGGLVKVTEVDQSILITSQAAGYGGHFRAVQGFRYRGEAWAARKKAEAQNAASTGN
jgi:hypothetical protein